MRSGRGQRTVAIIGARKQEWITRRVSQAEDRRDKLELPGVTAEDSRRQGGKIRGEDRDRQSRCERGR